MTTANIELIGWDIGGAHLKAVALGSNGQVIHIWQQPCPLWQGVQHIVHAMNAMHVNFNRIPHHAITMTGELVDLFNSRKEGVITIAQLMRKTLGQQAQLHFYDYKQGFVGEHLVSANAHTIASANWHVSVCWLLTQYVNLPNALLLDIGSTTTDIIPISAGKIAAQGFTDAERLQQHELVYTGVIRTPLMALASQVLFNGKLTNLAAEYFATTADIYRLTGDITVESDQAATADGKDKSALSTLRRLARMVGEDAENHHFTCWKALATQFKTHQRQLLQTNLDANIKRHAPTMLIGAGCGQFLVRELARDSALHYQDLTALIPPAAVQSLPAYAIAQLALRFNQKRDY